MRACSWQRYQSNRKRSRSAQMQSCVALIVAYALVAIDILVFIPTTTLSFRTTTLTSALALRPSTCTGIDFCSYLNFHFILYSYYLLLLFLLLKLFQIIHPSGNPHMTSYVVLGQGATMMSKVSGHGSGAVAFFSPFGLHKN